MKGSVLRGQFEAMLVNLKQLSLSVLPHVSPLFSSFMMDDVRYGVKIE